MSNTWRASKLEHAQEHGGCGHGRGSGTGRQPGARATWAWAEPGQHGLWLEMGQRELPLEERQARASSLVWAASSRAHGGGAGCHGGGRQGRPGQELGRLGDGGSRSSAGSRRSARAAAAWGGARGGGARGRGEPRAATGQEVARGSRAPWMLGAVRGSSGAGAASSGGSGSSCCARRTGQDQERLARQRAARVGAAGRTAMAWGLLGRLLGLEEAAARGLEQEASDGAWKRLLLV